MSQTVPKLNSDSAVRFVASDIGGTLADDRGQISERTARAVRRLLDNGIPFAVVTGQSLKRALKYRNLLDHRVSVVSSNGAVVIHNGTVLATKLLTANLARNAVEFCLKHELVPRVVIRDGTSFFEIPNRYRGKPPEETTTLRRTEDLGDVCKALEVVQASSFEATNLDEVCMAAREEFDKNCHVEFSRQPDGCWLEFCHSEARKAVGVETLAKHFQIPLHDVMYFGDNHNDIETLKCVGHPVLIGDNYDVRRTLNGHVHHKAGQRPCDVIERVVLGRMSTGTARLVRNV